MAAASDLQFALAEVNELFAKAHPGISVTPTYGSSGNFVAQISNGAPFDVYFSADIFYPRQLVEKNLAPSGALFTYAVGRIVVWVPKASPIRVEDLGIQALVDTNARKVAIANPEHAPYGRAAEAAMKSLGVNDAVKPRLVLGENIAQATQFVQSGAADIGIIALSLALAPTLKDQGRYWEVPLGAYPTLEQGGVVLSSAKDTEAANTYRDFVLGPEGRNVLTRYGFIMPAASAAP